MTWIIDTLNTLFWGYVLIYGLLGVGIFFTFRLGLLQFRYFGEMVRSILHARQSDASGISPFQALCTSLASRIGTGNLAGVAVALYLGGAGAIFWMWMVALVGMATAYSESTLAQLYKVRDAKGQYRGGPAFYISKGLKAPWAGSIFAICLIISFGLVFNAVQANSIADAMQGAFGLPKLWVGVVIAILAGLVIFGGLRSIARFAELVVPFMATAYVLVALVVLVLNITEVPGVLATIIKSAFGLEEAAGGVAGSVTAAMLNGIKRGLFSNEAGMGSAPNVAATATPAPHHPSSQGFVQAMGVFIDTIVICTATAIMILLSGALEPGSGVTGTQLTQQALHEHIGAAGTYFIAFAILFFAFTSIVANYSYAENALIYLGVGNTLGMTILRLGTLSMVIWGAYQAVTTVFDAADASMGLMATINLIAIVLLSGTVVKLTQDYMAQRKNGEIPKFKAADYPELKEKINTDIWR
ncbi:alanine/glycine:cation symporter family protein [Pseudomonas jilinensis]|uniref:Sodium:alanine symporter family protein n=1 Tax=Pseudomonas jilinensis TaxID=2078689 RepID=A0A396S5W8_9PSED|nr:alanine/glycine:cation symporter family protein [Pseudomonas jilinensis]RHW21491.1 sodium:alanine symporter family protein [Pseudomonas jilinensis]